MRAQSAPFTAYGTSTEAGDEVAAFIDGVLCGSTTATADGWLLQIPNTAPCDPGDGDTITFTLNGATVEETASWSLGGSPATSGYDPNAGIPLTAAATPTPTPTPEPTEEPTPEPTEEPTPTTTPEPTSTATPEPTSTPTEEPTPTATSEPTSTPTPTPTPTATATATSTATSTPTSSATVTIRPIGDPENGDGGDGFFGTFGIVIVVLLVLGGIGVAIVLPRLRDG